MLLRHRCGSFAPRAFAGTAVAVLSSTVLGLAVSTSHCAVCGVLRGALCLSLSTAVWRRVASQSCCLHGYHNTLHALFAVNFAGLVGAVIGVGIVGRFVGSDSELNVSMLKKIVFGWVATIPLAMLVSVVVYFGLMSFYDRGAKCS